MQEVLINSELKPFGERIEGKRDLLGATEVWQAVWWVLGKTDSCSRSSATALLYARSAY